MAVILTVEQLRTSFLPKWQRILRLQDWDITVDIKRKHDMGTEGVDADANVRWVLTEHTAAVEIIDSCDWDPGWLGGEQDMEFSLVHELVHLQLVQWKDNTLALEQAVHMLTQGLISLDRRAERLHAVG